MTPPHPARAAIVREHWPRYSALLDEVLDLAPAARAPWLAGLAARDATAHAAVQRLLAREAAEQGTTRDLLQREAGSASRQQFDAALLSVLTREDAGDAAQPGQSFGPWQVSRKLGSGGMGEVWLAERADALYEGKAAIKLLRGNGDASRLAGRFARERQALARLAHAGIARLLDAGVQGGQAYLVLDYVRGLPLLEHARALAPTVAARVRLVLAIGSALEYAHGRLIVHRDIKPSNVMVTAEGEVKLLDFGIASLLDDEHGGDTSLTGLYGRGLTLDYAAPEQITGEPTGVACDVFSLGVLLFELLGGTRPFKGEQPGRAALEHAVLHHDAPRLSRAIAIPLPADAAEGARPVDARAVRGDLEAIVAKALRKAPQDRYPTMAAFMADLERWLEHRPVLAAQRDWRRDSALWLRRNRLVAALSALVLLTLTGGLLASQQQLRRAQAAEARAESAANTSEAVTGYFTDDLLSVASASDIDTKTLTVLQLFERMAKQADTSLDDQPEVEARVRVLLASVFNYYGGGRPQELAEIAKAHQSLLQVGQSAPHRALALLRPEDALYYVSTLSAADLSSFVALVDRASALPDDTAAGRRQLASAQIAIALDAGQQRDDAVAGLARLDAVLAMPKLDAKQRWEARRSRARMLWLLDRAAPALAQYRQLMADPLATTLLGDRYESLRIGAQMGRLMLELGETDAAEKALNAFATLLDETAVADSIPVLRTRAHLALLREAQGRPAEAVQLMQSIDPIVQRRIATVGPTDAPFMIEMANEQAVALLLAGQKAEALRFSAQSMAALDAAITQGADADSSVVLGLRIRHAAMLLANGDAAAAGAVLAALSATALARQPPESPIRCELLQVEARLAEANGQHALAAQKLEAAERMLTSVFNAESWRVQAVRAERLRLGKG